MNKDSNLKSGVNKDIEMSSWKLNFLFASEVEFSRLEIDFVFEF